MYKVGLLAAPENTSTS